MPNEERRQASGREFWRWTGSALPPSPPSPSPYVLRQADWDEAEPEEGLLEDEEAEGEKEAAYAQEGLDRLCAAIEGKGIVPLLLPQVEALVGGGTWQQRHAALIAIAQVCDHCAPGLEPHLGSLVQLVTTCAAAPEARVRWAALYCLALLADQFEQLPIQHHAVAMSLVLRGVADPHPRVQAAAALAVCNLIGPMAAEQLQGHQQELLGALHARLATSPPPFVAYACASGLSDLFAAMGDAAAPTYVTFLPMLRSGFEAAIASRAYKLASVTLGALASLAAAVGAATFAPDAEAVVAPLVGLLVQQKAMLHDVGLLEPIHSALAKLAGAIGAAFQPYMAQVLPQLLEMATIDPESSAQVVEEVRQEEDPGWDTTYVRRKDGGYVRVCVHSGSMNEKVLGTGALFEYAQALGAAFVPFVPPAVEAASALLQFPLNPDVRVHAALALSECIRGVAAAAAQGEGGVAPADAAVLVGRLLKPLSEALHKEKELEPADAILSVFLTVLKAQRTTGTPLLTPPQVSGVIELLRHQLHADARRREARAAAADDEEDEAGGALDEEAAEQEWELLLTFNHCVCELLRQHGAAVVPAIEAQVCCATAPFHLARSCLPPLPALGGAAAPARPALAAGRRAAPGLRTHVAHRLARARGRGARQEVHAACAASPAAGPRRRQRGGGGQGPAAAGGSRGGARRRRPVRRQAALARRGRRCRAQAGRARAGARRALRRQQGPHRERRARDRTAAD